MLKAELEADFPYGVLLVTDAASTEEIPAWASPEEAVAVAGSAVVVRVRNADEGAVVVRVVDSERDATGGRIFAGVLEVKSGVLRVSDALGTATAEVRVPAGALDVELYADSVVEASAVYVVV